MKNNNSSYFIGLDIGTNSVGYAVTNEEYDLLKFKGEPMWGVHLFDEAKLNDERRNFRTARRRLNRKQQRIKMLQELFANEISKVDKNFFIRIKESMLYPEDTTCGASLFNDPNFNYTDYNSKFPTIHHLIMELINNPSPHDIRYIYIALAWLISHRGHFLNEISKDNLKDITDISNVYNNFIDYFEEEKPWNCNNLNDFGKILRTKSGINKKYKALSLLLFNVPKVPKENENESFLYDKESILKLLCGGKVSPQQLFKKVEYAEIDSFSLNKSDDELAPILVALENDAELVLRIKSIYDWAILSDVLQDEIYISQSKVNVYNFHNCDLKNLKYLIKKYAKNEYNNMFRIYSKSVANYESYINYGATQEDFCKYVKKILQDCLVEESDVQIHTEIMQKCESNTLCPKQVNSDNRVIPYQVYWVELKAILENASKYFDFINEKDDSGLSVYEKILSIFEFKIPYFVDPLNSHSKNSWIVRKSPGKIYPWNITEKVDFEASEKAFIDKMTNTCTYLPNEDVLPKMSLCYEKYQLLNEINAITINSKRLSPKIKKELFNELCLNRKKIAKESIKNFLTSNNYYTEEELISISGIDSTLHSSLTSHIAFKKLLQSNQLKEKDVEKIIERRTYTESKLRFSSWLNREYAFLSDNDRKYICSLKFKDFGRLSYKFLCDIYGTESNSENGEACTILERMWNENITLMEILSTKYTYSSQIKRINSDYFDNEEFSPNEYLSNSYISSPVKRSILRTLDIVSDIIKANKTAPQKIFIEMARGGKPNEKGNRKLSRYKQILDLYNKCDSEDIRILSNQLAELGDSAESKLQSDKLFLYYMQFGKCMYTGEKINLTQLSDSIYNIDHSIEVFSFLEVFALENCLLLLK